MDVISFVIIVCLFVLICLLLSFQKDPVLQADIEEAKERQKRERERYRQFAQKQR